MTETEMLLRALAFGLAFGSALRLLWLGVGSVGS